MAKQAKKTAKKAATKKVVKKTPAKAPRKPAAAKSEPKAKAPAKAKASVKTKAESKAKAVSPASPAKAAPIEASLAFAIDAARLAHDDKCTEVVLLDVRGLSQVTDYIVVGSGTSERQMRSVLDHIQDLGKTRNFTAFRTNSDERSLWLLADFVNVVVHLFEPATRGHYDLEMLWGDAPRVAWERPDQVNRDRAGLKA